MTHIRATSDSTVPRWVEDEMHNWARFQWEGEWPGPGRPDSGAPAVCEFPPQPDEQEEPAPVPICYDRAQKVHSLYEALPLVERRVIQAEYTRRREYGDLSAKERQEAASQIIGIPATYYRIALGSFKIQVWRMFG